MKKIFCLLYILLSFNFVFSISMDELEESLTATSIVLYDSKSDQILFERRANLPFSPASMTKLMTLYLTYEFIEAGNLSKDDIITITETGSVFSRPEDSSAMRLEAGQNLSLLLLMQGVAVASGNDAAYALAELVSGDVDTFVSLMNRKASDLGMLNSVFVDPDGYSALNLVTAEDYLLLADSYIDRFPEALEELHSVTELIYPLDENIAPEGLIRSPKRKRNTNWLLDTVEGVDGLKTGYIDESGFNFTVTALRGQTRFIAVLMGIFTDNYFEGLHRRANESSLLIEYAFEHFKTLSLESDLDTRLKVFYGNEEELALELRQDLYFTVDSASSNTLQVLIDIPEYQKAPISAGDVIGQIEIWHEGDILQIVDIVAKDSVERGSFIHNSVDFFERIFY